MGLENTNLEEIQNNFEEQKKLRPERIMLLSFNYTSTAKMYGNFNLEFNYIHGELEHPKNIIFGYGDELDKDYQGILEKNDNELFVFTSREDEDKKRAEGREAFTPLYTLRLDGGEAEKTGELPFRASGMKLWYDKVYVVNGSINKECPDYYKLSEEDKTTVQTEIDAFKKVREGNNAEEIKNAMEGFTQKVYAVFGKLYQQQAGAQGDPMNGANSGTGPVNDDGSVNADGSVE